MDAPAIPLPADPPPDQWYPPCRPLVVTSPFGPRPPRRSDGTPGPLHPGIDLAAREGQPLYAVADGVVARSYCSWSDPPSAKPGQTRPPGWCGPWPRSMGFGECIWLVLDDGRTVVYAHLSRRIVLAGEHVVRGQVIGMAGSTGYSSGPHLHLEVREARGFHDPLPLLAHLSPKLPTRSAKEP